MSNNSGNRRAFLKTVGVSAAALSAPSALVAEETTGETRVAPAKKSGLDGYQTDVLVVGGGPSGIGAALGAAKQGARTLLVENQAFFGGVAAWCLGMPVNQMRPAKQARSDIHELILQKLLALGDQAVRIGTLSRRQVVQMTEAMREFGGEELKDIELVGAGTQIGVRETRRVKGDYVLTEEDAMEGRTFDDVIAWRSGHLDIGFVRLTRMKIHDVPYRAIVPEKLDGLLVAGRCISATHVAASAGKSMGNCVATGHAAGIAAAMSAKTGRVPRELDVAEVQETLRADGVDLTRGGQDQSSWL